MPNFKVLLLDGIDPAGVDVIRRSKSIEPVVHDKIAREKLLEIIGDADGSFKNRSRFAKGVDAQKGQSSPTGFVDASRPRKTGDIAGDDQVVKSGSIGDVEVCLEVPKLNIAKDGAGGAADRQIDPSRAAALVGEGEIGEGDSAGDGEAVGSGAGEVQHVGGGGIAAGVGGE